MTNLPQNAGKNQQTPLPGVTCPDCGNSVDPAGPCWIRVSTDPEKTRRWHLECRDRGLREMQARYRVALEILTRTAQAAKHIGKSVDELQKILDSTPGPTEGTT